jgi:pimeloyl-ACP methyl ester carboxylesterase
MRVRANGADLWFDVSGPAVAVRGDELEVRPTVVTVHGGPGLDHIGLTTTLAPLAAEAQLVFYDQRGHGRSDYSDPSHWNLSTWATDLHDLCDAIGLTNPVVLGSSFGGFVALTYAAMFPDHPGGVVLSNTTGGRSDYALSIEVFRRLGGEEAAATAARDFREISKASAAEFNRVCYPLFSARPGFREETERTLRLATHTTEVNLHYWREEAPSFDPWTLLHQVTCPVLVIAGEDDPICPIEIVEDLVDRMTGADVELVRLPAARHAVFRDAPEAAFQAVTRFITRCQSTADPPPASR